MGIKFDRNDDLDKLFESFAVDPLAKKEVDKRREMEEKIEANLNQDKSAEAFINQSEIDDVRSNNKKIIK